MTKRRKRGQKRAEKVDIHGSGARKVGIETKGKEVAGERPISRGYEKGDTRKEPIRINEGISASDVRLQKGEKIEDTGLVGEEEIVKAGGLAEEDTVETRLDITTKILIVIFAILLLIIIFAKKLGIEGFP